MTEAAHVNKNLERLIAQKIQHPPKKIEILGPF